MQTCLDVEDKGKPIIPQFKNYMDLHVVFYQKGSWGAQAFSGEKEWWFPCHLNNKNNYWVIVWCWGCHGLHLHYAPIGGSLWGHQVCSKLQYFCLWLCGSYEYVLCIFLFTLLWSKEEVHWFVIQQNYWSCGLYSLQMPFNKDRCYVCTWWVVCCCYNSEIVMFCCNC